VWNCSSRTMPVSPSMCSSFFMDQRLNLVPFRPDPILYGLPWISENTQQKIWPLS